MANIASPSPLWVPLGKVTLSGSSTDLLFTAGAFSQVYIAIDGVSSTSTGTYRIALRNSTVEIGFGVTGASVATTSYFGFPRFNMPNKGVGGGVNPELYASSGSSLNFSFTGGYNATVADRVRLSVSTGSFDAGTMYGYGLLAY